MAMNGRMIAPDGQAFRGLYWRIADSWTSVAGLVTLEVEVYATGAARRSGEAPLYSVPALVGWSELGWAPGEPAPEVTQAALYHAVKAQERFSSLSDA